MSSLFLSQNALLLDKHIEIPTIADLSNDVALAIIIEDLVTFEYMRMVNFHEYVYFTTMQFLEFDLF